MIARFASSRMTTLALAWLFGLGLASAASAAMISVDTDKKFYLPTETINVTLTLTTTGAEVAANQVLLELLWDDPRVDGIPGPTMQPTVLTSPGFLWFPGAGVCLSAKCLVLDQISLSLPFLLPSSSVPDATTITTTLAMTADTLGLLNFSFGTTNVFGATPTMGANMAAAEIVSVVAVVPEPTAALLFGAGMLVVGRALRQRAG